nr:adenylate isopentenyltransferase-like [Ipomoea batatas]
MYRLNAVINSDSKSIVIVLCFFLMRILSSFLPPAGFLQSKSVRPRRKWAPPSAAIVGEEKEKVVVVMGATGSGKSRASIDLATRFFTSAEVINSDKIQVYKGLEITTNKITMPERKGVKHHLLGEFEASESWPEFSPADFRAAAGERVSEIVGRGNVPFIVGGSNSYIYALLVERFNSELNVFDESESNSVDSFCRELRYNCCFLWVDVSPPVLNRYLFKRVDDMMDSGMLDELSRWFSDPGNPLSRTGLAKAIGVPEFAEYFRSEKRGKRLLYEEAVREIKENTRQLAERQVRKIQRLREVGGWDLHRINATAAFAAAMGSESESETAEIWENQVVQPSMKIVEKFLLE